MFIDYFRFQIILRSVVENRKTAQIFCVVFSILGYDGYHFDYNKYHFVEY